MFQKTIGSRILHARKNKKLSQVDLSRVSNLTQAIISAYENDRVVPSERALRVLSTALGVKVSWLRYGSSDSGVDSDLYQLKRQFNILVKYLNIPNEIFNENPIKDQERSKYGDDKETNKTKTNKNKINF